MHNPIIYFTDTNDINLEELEESINLENAFPDPQHLSTMIDYVDYNNQSLTKEEIEDIFINCLPHTPFKIDESFTDNEGLIKIDVSKKRLINFLTRLSNLRRKVEKDKLYLFENAQLDIINNMNEAMINNYNQIKLMEKDETSGLFINVNEEIMSDSYTMNSFIESLKWQLDVNDNKSFFVLLTHAGDYHI
ncbi:hypothetical protein [Staphylococcus caprae]|uniref:hypothetical protein n=1 Tax=Staphylococcus caprae TaxID=29380 RepID=UPI000CD2628F|nr:hypothetical protein [Staphylococcus caprae]POA06094.1 hypothetical protein CD155_03880 [Staphylococcus caprae]SUL89815.1 Uncharacterised protein [Staphylococcus caprae]